MNHVGCSVCGKLSNIISDGLSREYLKCPECIKKQSDNLLHILLICKETLKRPDIPDTIWLSKYETLYEALENVISKTIKEKL